MFFDFFSGKNQTYFDVKMLNMIYHMLNEYLQITKMFALDFCTHFLLGMHQS